MLPRLSFSSSRISRSVEGEANNGVTNTAAKGFRGSPPSSDKRKSLRNRLALMVSEVTSRKRPPRLSEEIQSHLADGIRFRVGIMAGTPITQAQFYLPAFQSFTE